MGKDERSGSANALTNTKHEMFCQRMALGDNQTEAAKLAGYATSCASVQGHKLMQKPLIQQRVQYLRNRTSDVAIERVVLSKSWVLQNLKTVVERAMQAIPVTDAQGNKIGQYKFDGSAVNRALELIGKELRMFVERSEIGIRDLRNMSADDLISLLQELDSVIEVEPQGVAALPAGEEESVALVEAE